VAWHRLSADHGRFAALLLKFGNYLAQDEPDFLIEFLERTINARAAAET
jgi:hypothetical protein